MPVFVRIQLHFPAPRGNALQGRRAFQLFGKERGALHAERQGRGILGLELVRENVDGLVEIDFGTQRAQRVLQELPGIEEASDARQLRKRSDVASWCRHTHPDQDLGGERRITEQCDLGKR